MSLSKNEVMNEIYSNVDGQQETNERRTWSYEFRAEHTEVSSSSRWWIGTGEISSEKDYIPDTPFKSS